MGFISELDNEARRVEDQIPTAEQIAEQIGHTPRCGNHKSPFWCTREMYHDGPCANVMKNALAVKGKSPSVAFIDEVQDLPQGRPPKFRCSKFIEIDAAHRVPLHESKCRNLHGHRYKIIMTCEAEVLGSGPEDGMVMDFSFMKKLLTDWIDVNCDHGVILSIDDLPMLALAITGVFDPSNVQDRIANGVAGSGKMWRGQTSFGKTMVIPYVPTAENLARFWYELLKDRITSLTKGRASLVNITVCETPTSKATFPV